MRLRYSPRRVCAAGRPLPALRAHRSEGFAAYSEARSRLTGYAVGPAMLLEAATALPPVAFRPAGVPGVPRPGGTVATRRDPGSTALLQVPRHRAPGAGYDPDSHRFLVAPNRARTALWSVRGVLDLWMVASAM